MCVPVEKKPVCARSAPREFAYLCAAKTDESIMPEPKRTPSRARQSRVHVPEMNEYGHLQPQAPELEEAVLGALMIERDAYSLVSEILRPESFYDVRHQLIGATEEDRRTG